MVTAWSEHAARYVLASTLCPRCDTVLAGSPVCPSCAADFRGPEGELVWQASRRAGDALLERQRLIAELPTARVTFPHGHRVVAPYAGSAVPGAAPVPGATAAPDATAASAARPAPTTTVPRPTATDATPEPSSHVSVQSVLAVAGAGLLAVAAIVFTFLNPDIELGVRTTVIAVVTAAFLAGAWLLRRRDVRFSAEAIGALGGVFLALDVQAFSELAPGTPSGWVFGALGTFVAACLLLAVGWFARIRTWWWLGLVALALVPAFFGYAGGGWATAWGHIGVIAVALAAHELLRPASARFGSDMRADHTTLTVLQWIGTFIVLVQLPFLHSVDHVGGVLGRVALLVAVAVLAALAARNGGRGVWSFTSGTLAAVALGLVPLAPQQLEPSWLLALVPLGAALVLAASGLLRSDRLVLPRSVQAGALTVALGSAVPGLLAILVTCAAIVSEFSVALASRAGDSLDSVRASAGIDTLPADAGVAAVLGVVAVAAGAAVLAFATRSERTDASADAPDAGDAPDAAAATDGEAAAPTVTGVLGGFPVRLAGLATWLFGVAAVGFIGWSALLPVTQSLVGIAIALLASTAALAPWGRFAWARGPARIPLILLAHAALLEAAFISWVEPAITVPVGAVLVAALLMVMRTMPVAARPVHVGLAYAYALVLFATALDRVGVTNIAVLCLTTTLAALVALAATLVRRVDARSWYAILVVTFVPFLIGVASVLGERSGWTALSTGVMFLLALALVLTRRPGLNRFVRSAAAALLVPALAVVVVCLGAQLLEASGSPVVLPVIAVIVAVTLPATKAIESALVARGSDERNAASVRLWIEISSLVTAAIAVLLALVREAAGLGTAFAVLVVLGLGAAATSVFAGRRYGWWLAASSWTGALWCVWAMLGVDVVEPYTLPPAIGAAVVAAILVARGGRGVALFTSALACAIVPSLLILGAWGSGALAAAGPAVAWRTWALLTAALALLALGLVLVRTRRTSESPIGRLRVLGAPVFAAALVAASAGPIQAVRYGLERDPLPVALADPDLVMLPALGLSIAGALIAVVAAALLRRGAERADSAAATATATTAPRSRPSAVDRWMLHTRWLFAPALVFLVAGPISAIRRDWFAIWTLWTLMAVLLVLAVVTVARARRVRPVLPPFAFTYVLAWVTGVAGWSERDLRVEVFSIPLGLAVLVAGILAMRPPTVPTRPTLASWPVGFTGSWRLLAPGIVLTFLPSVLATGTDPQLYRPILVIALALVAILVGSTRKLAAPFILGLAVLPIENIVVFAAQLDRTVGAMPWWITLATAGAVLLAIAVGSERRTTQGRGVAARLRELE